MGTLRLRPVIKREKTTAGELKHSLGVAEEAPRVGMPSIIPRQITGRKKW